MNTGDDGDEGNEEGRERIEGEIAQGLVNQSINGIALHEIVTNDAGEPVDYRFLDVNNGFEEHTGLSAEDVVGKRVTTILPGIQETSFIEIYGRVALEGETVRLEKYSEQLEKHFDISAFSPREGLFVTTFFDITERKEREKQLVKKAEQLDAFAGRLAHEFRNSLSVMLAHIDLAQEAGRVDQVASIERSFNRMDRLVDDLIVLARDGNVDLSPVPVDLNCFAETCWEVIRAPDATLRIETEGRLMADEDRLRQLLENLYWHVLEHGGGGVTVTVGDLQNGFYVEDDGTEHPAERRAQLFEQETSALQHGTGLGLAIVRQTAAVHGWSTSIAEVDGGGFRIEFEDVDRLEDDTAG